MVVAGRRALGWAERCLESVSWQVGDYDVELVYVDDASGYDPVSEAALTRTVTRHRGRLLMNETRRYQIGSIARAIETITDPFRVVCVLDGDDYLLPHAFRTVAGAYSDRRVAFTYGSVLVDFEPYQDTRADYFGADKRTVNTEYSEAVWRARTFREDGFRCFHLRTFRRWLWDKLDRETLQMTDGTAIRGSGDSAYIFPMLEMLGDPAHVRFIRDRIYVYRLHDGCVHVVDKEGQHDGLEDLRFRRPPYRPLPRGELGDLLLRAWS